ncbi:DUF3164 family protein [Vibrio sp. DW001]|uniref:DUF3164 family protein n=1 Tax=Vibrio TaxID=662 RepID=UPI000C85B038|nr:MULTISPECIES: DUF3164 family protein [Vibrio]PMM05699.1 sulfate transporter [Vibrio kanaloae]WED29193.1 DUF3164 family protein [Vibrio sp. DW001]
MTNQTQQPEGWKLDRKGRLVQESNIDDYDIEMDAFVMKHMATALEIQAVIREFKKEVYEDCLAFQELIAEKYDTKIGGKKGGASFTSFDGKKQIRICVQDRFVFGPELKVAEKLMKECANDWSENANRELQLIIHGLFETDKEGSISVKKVMDFRSQYKSVSEDARWVQAMAAIDDAQKVVSSKTYLNFKERNGEDKYINIPLDIAKL